MSYDENQSQSTTDESTSNEIESYLVSECRGSVTESSEAGNSTDVSNCCVSESGEGTANSRIHISNTHSTNERSSIDDILQKLSDKLKECNNKEQQLLTELEYEEQIGEVARLIEEEERKSHELEELFRLLVQEHQRLKTHTIQCRWRSRVENIELLLNERQKSRKQQLRNVIAILENSRTEKEKAKRHTSISTHCIEKNHSD